MNMGRLCYTVLLWQELIGSVRRATIYKYLLMFCCLWTFQCLYIKYIMHNTHTHTHTYNWWHASWPQGFYVLTSELPTRKARCPVASSSRNCVTYPHWMDSIQERNSLLSSLKNKASSQRLYWGQLRKLWPSWSWGPANKIALLDPNQGRCELKLTLTQLCLAICHWHLWMES